MKQITNPSVASFAELFELCVKNKYDPAKELLRSGYSEVSKHCSKYVKLAAKNSLYKFEILSPDKLPEGAKSELNKLYTERFAQDGAPGRVHYDKILLANKRRCPFCGHNCNHTVDHFLPKDVGKFPELSILPENLVPACSDCNKFKGTHYGDTPQNQLFHPYYENPDIREWLFAKLHYSVEKELTVTFFTANFEEHQIFTQRLQNQFERLRLNELYSSQAASELEDLNWSLKEQLKEKGKQSVLDRLNEDFQSFRNSRRNSWKTAMYRELARDPEFANLEWT